MKCVRLGLVLVGLLAAQSATTAWGGTGDVVSSPAKGRNKHGLNVTVDSRGVDSEGYRPFVVKITPWPAVPATAERSIRVTLFADMYDPGSFDTSVSGTFELAVGQAAVEGTIFVPQDRPFNMVRVEVHEDGGRLDGLEMRINNPRNNWWNHDAATAILFVDSVAPARDKRRDAVAERRSGRWKGTDTNLLPDVRHLTTLFPDQSNGTRSYNGDDGTGVLPKIADVDTLVLVNDHNRFEMQPPSELPENWLALSGYDAIFISRADLAQTAKEYPRKLQALGDWLATGCMLIVTDGGEDFARVPEIEELLQLKSRPIATAEKPNAKGWLFPDEQEFKAALDADANGSTSGVTYRGGRAIYYNRGQQTIQIPELTKAEEAQFRKSPPFLYRSAGLGCLVVFHEAEPLPGKLITWKLLFDGAGRMRSKWHERHGVSTSGRNPGYWSFLIPGVGRAPVLAFLVLITLFMLIIGPVNYWLLRRAKRTHLLLVTVPLGALAMTAGLFLYALITDGLGVSSRIRSFTQLDDRGRAVSWSRQSYYASLTPSAGLVFPADTAAFSINPNAWREQSVSRRRTIAWEDDQQRLRSGFMRPRTVTQFLTVRATGTKAKLELTSPRDSLDPPQIVNRLGQRIQVLLAKNDRGELFRGADIAADAAATLVPQTSADATNEWKALCDLNEPKSLDHDQRHDANLFSFIIPDFNYMWVDSQGPESSVLERRLERLKAADLEPGTFIAVIERPSEVPKAVASAVEKAGFHVIGGSW